MATNQGSQIAFANTETPQTYYDTTDLAVTYSSAYYALYIFQYSPLNPRASKDIVLLDSFFVAEGNGSVVLDSGIVQSLKDTVKYLYLTSGTAPNQWNMLSSYFEEFVNAVERAVPNTTGAAPI